MKKWLIILLVGLGGVASAKVTQEEVLRYWLGPLDGPTDFPVHKAQIWWMKDPEVDADIRQKFGAAVEAAARGEYDHWTATPRGRLALIILLDQFTRNLNRDKGEAFANDEKALRLAMEGIARGEHTRLYPVERAFLYLPLEHAEDPYYQERSVDLFEQLAREVDPEIRAPFESFLDYARQHKVIIDRFARFPHRNRPLLRDSTQAEVAFLREWGNPF
ncbi:MAG: DUF924 family protein [Parachlamydiales bacterium]